jgi:serine/threonine protein kinase
LSHNYCPDKPDVRDVPEALVRFDDSETPGSFAAGNAARNSLGARHLHDVLYKPEPLDTPETPLTPDTILQDRYRIVRQLGRGGMGAVYEAVDQRLDKTLAIKETLSSEASMRKQFEREARLLAVMHHPALPKVTDHFVEGNRAFLVMEFIGGYDLARIIAQQPGPFPRDQVIAWADQLLDALIYLHTRDRQVIHRDIKPHNLKLTATGQIALLDFGLAKSQPSDPSVTASQAFFGYTRHYAPLEQIQDQHTDPRSDIYALGATLYHLLTGVKPPDAMVRAAAVVNGGRDPLRPANEIHAAVGPQIAAILNKAMAQKPEDRYTDANEFREALRRMGRTQAAGVEQRVDAGEEEPRINADARESAGKGIAAANVSNEKAGSVQRSGHAVGAVDGGAAVDVIAPAKPTVAANPVATAPGSDKKVATGYSSDKRVGNSSGFDILVVPPDMHMELVGSARRFGPAGVTIVLAMIFAIAGGILYASQRWFPSAETASEVLAESPNAAALRSSAATRKQDRARVADSSVMPTTKTVNASIVNAAPVEHAGQENLIESGQNATAKSPAEKRTAAIESARALTEKRTGAVAKPPTSSNANGGQESPRVVPRKEPRRVDAPSIRFPKVEFREPRDNRDNGGDNPAPPAREWRQHSDAASGSAGKPASNFVGKRASVVAGKPAANSGGPKFYRTADGTQIVKFPDGSTQYVRPGQRSAVNR